MLPQGNLEERAYCAPDYRALVQTTRVHSSLYYDDRVFQDELDRIWHKTWIYVGHVSEVPNRNDYVTRSIGPTPILMVHDRHGRISLLQNKCPHRGNQLCAYQKGNRKTFTCPYHSWTFANSGELMGLAFPDGYDGVDKRAFSLGRVPRIGIYRGFVFGSFAEDGSSLEAYLGGAKASLDQLLDNSPEGEIEITAGFLQHRTKANWKFLVENETDGYHPGFVHGSIFQVTESPVAGLYRPESPL
jgi:phenylpropionate dioxygenase-like ring-hydroxylating dioxygenase large terminal subunit